MKIYFLNLLSIFPILFLIGCSQQSNSELPKFSFNENTYLRFHVTNCKTSTNFTLIYNSLFPHKQTKLNIFFDKDTTKVIKLIINHPLNVNFFTANSFASCYVLPEDTLDIWLDLDATKEFRDNIVFKGKTASVSNYLTKHKVNTSTAPAIDETVNEYNQRVDTLTTKKLTALYTFNKKEPLQEWFMKMEETEIQYSGARDKIYQFSTAYLFYDQYKPRPDDFIDKLGVKIDNQEAKFSESYYDLLCLVSTNKYDTLLSPQNRSTEVFYKFVKENLKFAQKYLHSEIKDLFIAQRVGSFFSTKFISEASITNSRIYSQRVDTLINFAETNLTDTVILNVLLSYQNDQIRYAKELESLKPGTIAPDFKLTDLSGKTITLSEFKGRYVYINFWADWCSPCIKTIPEKNKLYHEYNNNVVFLNVCIDPDSDKWRKLIYDNNFQGIHLICKGDWINLLSKSYYITSIPHYVLVDKKGQIIKNNVANLNELEDLIKTQI